MKRMIYVWILLILVLFAVGIVHGDWAISVNDWTKVIFILLLLLLGIEIGLYFWRRKMLNVSQLVKNSQMHKIHTEQEDHYVPPINPD